MSELPLPLKRSWLAQLGPLTMMSVGIILSFTWAAFLGWLIVCVLNGLI
jgi:hypothetical protein